MTGSDLFAGVPPEVTIVEVGPRDGLQNEAAPVPVAVVKWFQSDHHMATHARFCQQPSQWFGGGGISQVLQGQGH